MVYADVATATDLQYTPSASSVKEQLLLRTSAAPRTFTFHLADPHGLLGVPTRAADESWTFSNPAADGARVTLAAPAAWSQSASPAAGTRRHRWRFRRTSR